MLILNLNNFYFKIKFELEKYVCFKVELDIFYWGLWKFIYVVFIIFGFIGVFIFLVKIIVG